MEKPQENSDFIEDGKPSEKELSPEQVEIAERVSREKLELLLGEKPLEQFGVRFMNLEEYQKMMRGELVGNGEANIFGMPIKYRPDLLVSKHALREMEARKSQGYNMEIALENIQKISVEKEQRMRGIRRPEQSDVPLEDPSDFIPSEHLSPNQQEEYFRTTFEDFLEDSIADGWFNTIKAMTDWEMSGNAAGAYAGFYNRRGWIFEILDKTAREAKKDGLETEAGETKKAHFLSLLRKQIEQDARRELDKFEIVESRLRREGESAQLGEVHKMHLTTIRSFLSDENYLNVSGNIQKLFYALANVEDIFERLDMSSGGVQKLQYHVAVVFGVEGVPEGTRWGRKEWGHADRNRDNILAAIALLPNPDLEKELKTLSLRAVESAYPVFNSYGSLKFPEIK